MKWIIWKFDIIIYRLFYWRWNSRFINNKEIRDLFLRYLQKWDAIDREPAMGIGVPPKYPEPNKNRGVRHGPAPANRKGE